MRFDTSWSYKKNSKLKSHRVLYLCDADFSALTDSPQGPPFHVQNNNSYLSIAGYFGDILPSKQVLSMANIHYIEQTFHDLNQAASVWFTI